jgi:NADPH-dependent 2,4-dienoyl-CoA reductase/sulfur reductase-like enzyme
LAPELDVVVVDRSSTFVSLPLSNPWLVGMTPERLARLDLATLAGQLGYRFVQAEVLTIDRAKQSVQTSLGVLDYDWLVLASGISYDYEGWFGGDFRAAEYTKVHFSAGFLASELDAVKRQLDGFRGGDLVMTIPPPPHRCPPAPYERAMLIAWMLKEKRIPGKLTLIDAGGGMPRFTRLFAERYANQITYRAHSTVLAIDPFAKTVSTDDGELRFEHALLLPPVRANALVEQAGLLGINGQGKPTRWAAVDPFQLNSPMDENVYLVGDLLDAVSPLFGYYPKTAHMATRLGQAAAAQISARSRGLSSAPVALPQSICHVWTNADPQEQLRLDAQFALRGDGVISQTIRQHDNPQPRDEDLQWAQSLYSEALGVQ